jgi:hypothetical protein
MKYHPNSNSRYRGIRKRISACLCRFYRNGIPQTTQINNNGHKEYGLKVFDPTNGRTVSFASVSTKSPTGDKGKLVAHYGLPPEALPYLALFS